MLTAAKRDQYVAALRSGKYNPGKGQLYKPDLDCYCALGVIAAEEGLSISEDGMNIIVNNASRREGYRPLYDFLGPDLVDGIWRTNDRTEDKNPHLIVAEYLESLNLQAI